MTQIVESLFGVSPERYQQQKDAALQQEALAYAQLDPYQRASAGIYAGARGLASGIGRMLGGEDPGMRRVTEQDQIIRSINLNDPETYGPAAQRAYQMGHTELAQKILLGADTAYQRQEATRQRAAGALSRRQTAEAQAMLPNLMREARPEQMVSTDDTGVVNTIPAQAAGIDPDIQRRLMGTVIGQGLLKSFGEAQKAMQGEVVKPNIAPINIKDYTPESVKAYLNSLNPGSLVPVAQKPVSPYTPIDPSKYTQDSLKAYGLSQQVSDLVPVPAKAVNPFGPINVKDFTPDSVKAFAASQNIADLIPVPAKAVNPFGPITPKDYTQDSLKAYGLSGQVSDLVPVPVSVKAASPFAPINVKDYTPESLKAYGISQQVSDLVPVPAKQKANIGNIDPSKFTPASVAKYAISENYGDLDLVAPKAERPQSLVSPIDASKFTAPSVSAYSSAGGDYSLLVPVTTTAKTDRTIANVNPNDFTPSSLDKYLISGKYSDLVRVAKAGGEGTVDKAPTLDKIVDPTNPNQILSINARLYKGGGIGSPGVIGLSSKTLDTAKAKPLPANLSKAEESDYDIARDATNIATDAYEYIGRVKSGEIKFSLKDRAAISIQNAFGSENPVVTARNDFDKFIQKLTNETLRLNTGVQTDYDYKNALKEIKSSESPADVATTLQKLVTFNLRRVKDASESINRRRKNAGATEVQEGIVVPSFDVHVMDSQQEKSFLANPKYPAGTNYINPQGQRMTKTKAVQ